MQATQTTPAGETYDQTVNTFSTLQDQLVDMAEGLVRAVPGMVIALLVLLLTWIVAKFAVRIADRLIGSSEIRPSLKQLIDTIVRLTIWIIGLMVALIVVMPGMTPASLLAGLGIGAVAIGFAFQDIFENFLAGVLIMVREKMRIGDVIECEGITGKVEHITLRETHVRKLSGELTVVPNSILFKNPVEIFTDEEQRRHEVVVGVSYDTQLDHAADVIRRAVEDIDDVLASKGIDIFAQEFNSSSVDFLVRWWAGSTPRDGWESKDKVVRAIKAALDEAGIEIPFPYVTHTFKETVPVSQLGDTSRKTP
ncbi:mechanosensitive ion channel family protein [Erythrobacter sp.]|uniref:mechanosensitive ion channel family protein n=1 Tax=Erythrobacter sp. TaxID=1042 RepID=UPI001B02DF2A|nr:mechanosensitive ion channel family protein [Erythrobacter sp.]MBO6526085.1 mechanosensitive ion channel [Erythrobacter sp.]MBO6531159.1 mechanosensitive ion channel [Erythrobacter sp.]MBO6768612.1 mechanosensitive ion channel [Erythrobacter sp.]